MPVAGTVISPSNLPNQVSTDDPQGQILGPRPTSLIGFYGLGQGVPQPSGGLVAETRGNAEGTIFTIYSATTSPSAVGPNTTVESGITPMAATVVDGVATGDLLFVNKPTSQAGLGVGNVRVSGANSVAVNFSNFTAATVTPTATQSYGLVAVRGFVNTTVTLTPAAVGPTTTVEQQFSGVTAIAGSGDLVQVNKPTSQAGLEIVGVRAVGLGILGITFANLTAVTITPTAGEGYGLMAVAGIDPADGLMAVQEVQTPAALTNAVQATAQSLTFTNLLKSDIVLSVQKPTLQSNLGIAGALVTAANTLSVNFTNFAAATVTPTAAEVYAITIMRANPAAPMVKYTQTLTPVAVAPNTTAEQTFTVTGLIASSMAWVNKPSWTKGLAIVGVRVSAANTLAVNFGNLTAATITPPSESYVIGNFQALLGDAGSTWSQTISATDYQQSRLSNSMRNALVSLNLVASA